MLDELEFSDSELLLFELIERLIELLLDEDDDTPRELDEEDWLLLELDFELDELTLDRVLEELELLPERLLDDELVFGLDELLLAVLDEDEDTLDTELLLLLVELELLDEETLELELDELSPSATLLDDEELD